MIPLRLPLWIVAAVLPVICQPVFAQQRLGRPQRGDFRMASTVRVGDKAPDFKLKAKDGSREVALSSFRGKKPVVLIFGSFT